MLVVTKIIDKVLKAKIEVTTNLNLVSVFNLEKAFISNSFSPFLPFFITFKNFFFSSGFSFSFFFVIFLDINDHYEVSCILPYKEFAVQVLPKIGSSYAINKKTKIRPLVKI
jgi:hypothetical protein